MKLTKGIPFLFALGILPGGLIHAQKKVGFNGQQIEMAELKSTDKTAIAAKVFAGKKLVIVEGNPENFGKGLALGNNRFLISIPAESGGKELFNAGIKSWAPVSSTSKVSPGLKTKITTAGLSALDIYVLCIPGMDEKQIRAAWSNNWGQIKNVWKEDQLLRLTISANSAQIKAISNEGWSMQLEEAEGEIIPHNQTAADNGRINTISAAGFGWSTGLTGKGVTVGIGDGGLVDYHVDLESHQFNLITSKLSSFGDHPDHVSGTIAGLGLIIPDRRGMAPEAVILNHQTSNIISNAVSLRTKQNMTLTNNSYGNTLNCTRVAQYNSTASLMDGQTASNPDLLHVVSAGNAGASTCSPYPSGFYNMSDGYPVAKNCLTVGQVNASDAVNVNSCKGPARDGRLKPDIVANGELTSTTPGDAYGFKSGTSQAAPVLTGTMALLTERYKQINGNQNPDASLLKALVCNTADDLGLPNADFSSGYGRLNARKARRVLENAQFSSNSIGSNTSQSFNLTVPAGAASVKIMLAWTDPAAAASPVRALINDLNLSVIRSNGTVTLPWVPNPSVATINQAAARGTDSLNNMEQATLTVTPGEVLTIRTSSRTISGSNQKYWIVYDWVRPELVLTAPLHNQMLPNASSLAFRWDFSSYAFSSFFLETSTDSANWTTAQTISSPAALTSSFTPSGTGFRRVWFRFRGVSSGQTILSNAVKVFLSPQPVPVANVCDRTARLSWTAVSGATRYEAFKINRSKGAWESQGFTTGLVFHFGGLENGKREILAIRPWFGNEAGMRSSGIAATPAAGSCAWTRDLGISRLISPASGRLLTSSAPSASIQLELQNYSNTAISAQACTLNYRRPDGTVQQFPLSLTIGAGIKQNYTVPVSFNNTTSGTQRLRFWLSTAGDVNSSNDSLQTDVKVLANNPERAFPLSLNFESLPSFYLNAGSAGISGEDRFDYTSTNQARVMAATKNLPLSFGSRSLVLDKERVDTRTGTGESVITLNLAAFPFPKELKISFDCMIFNGSVLPAGNAFSFRPSDQAAWITVRNFATESFVAGTSKRFSDIDLLPLLGAAPLTSSFQLRFTFSGTRNSEIETLGGYAVDNIVLTLPSADVKAKSLILPPDDCYSDAESRPVRFEIQNLSQVAVQKIPVYYQIKGSEPVADTVQSLAAGETLTFTFGKSLGNNESGKLEIRAWVKASGDINISNDELPFQQVIHYRVINQFPYLESFEETAGSWVSYSIGNQGRWQWGSGLDKLTAIDSAANGLNFWFTNPASEFNNQGLSYLQSPCFDISSLNDFQTSFHRAGFMNGTGEQGWLEVSVDGLNWTKAGNSREGMNWYNEQTNNWGNIQNFWLPSSFRFSKDNFVPSRRIRFRFVFKQETGIDGRGFAVDDFHVENSSSIDTSSRVDQSFSGGIPDSWLYFGEKDRKAAMVEDDGSIGVLNFQSEKTINQTSSLNGVLLLNRNFLLNPVDFNPGILKIRLFFPESDIKDLMNKDLMVKSFQDLGIFRYQGTKLDLLSDNNEFSSDVNFEFLSGQDVLKVPTFGGYYFEFKAIPFSEFYICRRSPAENYQAAGLRMNSADLPPHQPVQVKWLTPVDETAGRELDQKIAWLDPSAEILYLDGINGNSARIRLIDLKGQILLDEAFTGFRFETRTSSLAKGVYTLRVEQESGAETFRLMLD